MCDKDRLSNAAHIQTQPELLANMRLSDHAARRTMNLHLGKPNPAKPLSSPLEVVAGSVTPPRHTVCC